MGGLPLNERSGRRYSTGASTVRRDCALTATKKDGGTTTERRGISFQWLSPNFLLHSDKSLGPAQG